jgi:tetratricopeptide (TPR) repeat protein
MIYNLLILALLVSTPSEHQLSFANHLFEEGDYFRAITEYKRLIFLSSDPEEQLFAKRRIFSSYKRAGRFQDAASYLTTLQDEHFKNTESGKLYLLMHDTEQSRQYFKLVNSDTVRMLIAWSYMEDGNWKRSEESLARITRDSEISGTAARLALYAGAADTIIPHKSPMLSGLLSVVIPGAGRCYTGRAGDGVFSFITVAIPASIAYFYWQDDRKRACSIAAGISAVFYLGDIYGSVVSAQEFNRFSRSKYIESINSDLCITEHYIE